MTCSKLLRSGCWCGLFWQSAAPHTPDCGTLKRGTVLIPLDTALPSGTWQSYDIVFRAARWENGQKTGDARTTVYLNGEKVQDDVALSASTLLGGPEADSPGPIVLQDHGSKVSFRNVWMLPGAAQEAELP